MTDREQLVKEAEALAERLESFRDAFSFQTEGYDLWNNKALIVRRLLSLLPKEGEVVMPDVMTDEMYLAFKSKGSFDEAYKAMIEARPK